MAVWLPKLPKSRPGEMGAAEGPWAGGGVTTYPPGSSSRRLAELEEACGLLQEITCADGCTLARFEWGSVALPEELEPRLSGLVGRTVAVLRAECYHVRLVE